MTGREAKLDRCYLVYALAAPDLRAGDANTAFNEYIDDPARGLVLFHDHFVGERGGVAVFYVEDDAELARLDEEGPLRGWRRAIHPLVFSGAPSGFHAQIDFTLRTYRATTLEEAEAREQPSARDCRRRPSPRTSCSEAGC
jgi:hypothetical protein